MIVPNFIGGSYRSQSLSTDCELTANYYPEIVGSPDGKNRIVLYRTPGMRVFGTAPDFDFRAARGAIQVDGRYYRANGNELLEIHADGSNVFLGNIALGDRQAQFASNSAGQVAVASGGELYIIETAGNTLTHVPISDSFFGADAVTYGDSYFIVLSKGISQFQISDFNNGLVWDAADVSGRIPMSDSAINLIWDRGLLWIYTGRQMQIWTDTSDINFPFSPMGSAIIETGLGAKDSLCQFDNALIWVGQDIRGARMCMKASGNSPVRVSNHAVEYAWSQYSTIQDAVAYVRQDRGHTFYRVTFPTADKTWELDAESGLWTQPTFTDTLGNQRCRPERDHVYCFATHLVGIGDTNGIMEPGVVMELTADYYSDDGYLINPDGSNGPLNHFPVVRDRIAPLPNNENKRMFLSRFELEFQRGIGLNGDVDNDPKFMLRNSWDGGYTWGNELEMRAGGIGEYSARAFKNRLGSGRDPAIWVRTSAPVNFCLINAYIEMQAGSS